MRKIPTYLNGVHVYSTCMKNLMKPLYFEVPCQKIDFKMQFNRVISLIMIVEGFNNFASPNLERQEH